VLPFKLGAKGGCEGGGGGGGGGGGTAMLGGIAAGGVVVAGGCVWGAMIVKKYMQRKLQTGGNDHRNGAEPNRVGGVGRGGKTELV
jgi:hypothetical protein